MKKREYSPKNGEGLDKDREDKEAEYCPKNGKERDKSGLYSIKDGEDNDKTRDYSPNNGEDQDKDVEDKDKKRSSVLKREKTSMKRSVQ